MEDIINLVKDLNMGESGKVSGLRIRGLVAGLNQEMLEWLKDSSAPDTRVSDGGMFDLVGEFAIHGYILAWERRTRN